MFENLKDFLPATTHDRNEVNILADKKGEICIVDYYFDFDEPPSYLSEFYNEVLHDFINIISKKNFDINEINEKIVYLNDKYPKLNFPKYYDDFKFNYEFEYNIYIKNAAIYFAKHIKPLYSNPHISFFYGERLGDNCLAICNYWPVSEIMDELTEQDYVIAPIAYNGQIENSGCETLYQKFLVEYPSNIKFFKKFIIKDDTPYEVYLYGEY